MDASTSCERCKRRKSKCDRSLPACSRCAQSQLPCVYPDRRRPGFAAGHRQVLESRISSLQAENERLRAGLMKEQVQHMRSGQSTSVSAVPQAQHPTPASTQISTSRETAHLPALAHNAVRHGENVFQATYARTSNIAERKPPLDLVISSVSVFLRHIHPWFPCLDVQQVLSELVTTREPSLLLYAIFGASLPFLHDPRLDQATSDSFWKYTKRKIFVETTEEPSYFALQACNILTLDLSGMTNGPQVWSRLAVVTKLAAQLRTPAGKTLRPMVQTGEEETSRPESKHHARLFWAIYALDSFVSITTGQPPQLTDFHLRPFLPTREAAWDEPRDNALMAPGGWPPSPTRTFRYSLELLDISRKIHGAILECLASPDQHHAPPLNHIHHLLDESDSPGVWLQNLPDNVTLPATIPDQRPHRPTVPPSLIMLHAYSHALTLHAKGLVEFYDHASQVEILSSSPDRQKLTTDCQTLANTIADLWTTHAETAADQLGWPCSWSLWTAARYLLTTASRRPSVESIPLPPAFNTLLRACHSMGDFWQVSRKYWRLLSRAEEALRTGGGDDGGSRLLAAVVDLRIPTADLEDQFRIDPVLCDTSASADGAAGTLEADPDAMIGERSVVDEECDAVFGRDEYGADIWFANPLSASSGYHVFPESMANLEGEGWGLSEQ